MFLFRICIWVFVARVKPGELLGSGVVVPADCYLTTCSLALHHTSMVVCFCRRKPPLICVITLVILRKVCISP